MPAIIAGAAMIAGAFGMEALPAAGTSALLGTAITSLAEAGVSFLLAGVADALHHDLGVNVAVRQTAAPWTIVCGRARVGGTIAYVSNQTQILGMVTNKYLHLIVVHAACQVESISALHLNGQRVYQGGDGYDDNQTHVDPNGYTYNFKHTVYWETRLGSPTQAWMSTLGAFDPKWNSSMTLSGLAYSYIRLTYDADVWKNGIPSIRVDVQGKNTIFDPRDGSHSYSENWALCVADLLTNPDYGLQCSWDEIDQVQLRAAANICDEQVPLAGGGTEARYTCNGSFTSDQAPGDILRNMLTAAAGRVTYVQGLWKIYPAAYQSPSLSLSDSDLFGQIRWLPKRKYRDLVNAVKGTYVSPSFPYLWQGPGVPLNTPVAGTFDAQWKETDMPPYAQDGQHGYGSDANYAADNNTRLWLDTRFPFTISCATAQRLAKILLLRNRQQGTGTLVCRLSAYQAQCLDVIQFSHPRYGWTNKLLEISQSRLNFVEQEGQAPHLTIELDVQETDPSVYAWSTSEQLQISGLPNGYGPGGEAGTLTYSGTTATWSVTGGGTNSFALTVSYWDVSGGTYGTDTVATGASGSHNVASYLTTNYNFVKIHLHDSTNNVDLVVLPIA